MRGDLSGRRVEEGGLAPDLRLRIVREYAISVFGKETTAAAWLGRTHAAIDNGTRIVSVACQDAEGFREAMAELERIEARRRSDELKR